MEKKHKIQVYLRLPVSKECLHRIFLVVTGASPNGPHGC